MLSSVYLGNQHSFILFTVHLSSCAVPWLVCAISGQTNVHSDTTKLRLTLNFINLWSLSGSGDLDLSKNHSVKPCFGKNKYLINVYLFIPHFSPKLTSMSSKLHQKFHPKMDGIQKSDYIKNMWCFAKENDSSPVPHSHPLLYKKN